MARRPTPAPGGSRRSALVLAVSREVARKRRDDLVFATLIVLLTPVLAVAAVATFLVAIVYVDLPVLDHHLYEHSLATGLLGFTGFLLVAVALRARGPRVDRLARRRALGSAAAIFALLLGWTYATPLRSTAPGVFWTVFGLLSVSSLVAAGQVYRPAEEYDLGVYHGLLDWPFGVEDDVDRAHFAFALVTAIPEFVARSYAAMVTSRWLWKPPEPEAVRDAAEVLCWLQETGGACSVAAGWERGVRLLVRLGWTRVRQGDLEITLDGRDALRRARGT